MEQMRTMDNRFKLARIQAGLSQRDLALRVGVSEHLVSKWETGRLVPDAATRERVAAVLGKRSWEIFSR
ncbi:MAG: helix-turn-helix transcriptional regulator [Kiritimatiellaeota bacterium]|nr:helix-turn-helix transcriptional regulator [Kiritimatiellota bacterium]